MQFPISHQQQPPYYLAPL